MANLRPLRPSLKEKKRYVVFRVDSEMPVSVDDLISSVNAKCLEFMGVLLFGKAGVMIIKNQFNGNYGIIKVGHKYVDHIKASLMQVTEVKGIKANIEVKGISGILKKAKEKFMKS